jgi:uncharacterized protein YdhG (YjbR/CyaY superfamily)
MLAGKKCYNLTMLKTEKPKTVTEYINTAPKEARKKLREMRTCLRKAAPKAEENVKWGMPAFSHKRILFTYAGFKRYIGFYPMPSAVRAFANDLSEFKTAKGSVQFPLDKPLPLPLILKIASFRVKEEKDKDAKRR